MSKRKLRKYDKEFKANTVNLYREGSRSLTQLSQELGVPAGTLGDWVTERKRIERPKPPSYAEMAALRKELAITRQERDILKKALGIFSLPSK